MSRLVDNKPCKLPDGPANNQNMMTIKKQIGRATELDCMDTASLVPFLLEENEMIILQNIHCLGWLLTASTRL